VRRILIGTVAAVLAALNGSAVLGIASGDQLGNLVAPPTPSNVHIVGGAGGPSTIGAIAGTPQAALINAAFGTALQALVRDAGGTGVAGVAVTFIAPSSGATASFGSGMAATVSTDPTGTATAPTLIANALVGSYVVTASLPGSAPASFNLSNSTGVGPPSPWTSVTPGDITLDPNGTSAGAGQNFGIQGVHADPSRPGTLYASVTYQGLWKSTDFGVTWGKVNVTGGGDPTGRGRANIRVAPDGSYIIATSLYPMSGTSNGAWKSADGGQTWNRSTVGAANGDDLSSFEINPNDKTRVLASPHSPPYHMYESRDAGQSWTDMGAMGNTSNAALVWVDNDTVLAISDGDNNNAGAGTWRGVRSGPSWPWSWTWTHVSTQQHWHGSSQSFVDAGSGTVFTGGGFGIQRSTDKGLTWTTVSTTYSGGIVATPTTLYSTANYASQGGFGPWFQRSSRTSGGTAWVGDVNPPAMNNGWHGADVVFDGSHYIIVSGNWNAGIWRYVE
jgi:hypothetical protein